MGLRPITKEEWDRYRWIEVSGEGEEAVFLPGIELCDPPDDGYAYVDRTRPTDTKQRWVRAETSVDEDIVAKIAGLDIGQVNPAINLFFNLFRDAAEGG